MANKKPAQKKKSGQHGSDGRSGKSQPMQTEKNKQGEKNKQKGGPSKKSGMLSIGMAVFAVMWTVATYLKSGPGMTPLLGLLLAFFCLLHATYNFQGVKRQKAMDRGESEKKSGASREELVGTSTEPKKLHTRAYSVYRVKRKPIVVLKKKR